MFAIKEAGHYRAVFGPMRLLYTCMRTHGLLMNKGLHLDFHSWQLLLLSRAFPDLDVISETSQLSTAVLLIATARYQLRKLKLHLRRMRRNQLIVSAGDFLRNNWHDVAAFSLGAIRTSWVYSILARRAIHVYGSILRSIPQPAPGWLLPHGRAISLFTMLTPPLPQTQSPTLQSAHA